MNAATASPTIPPTDPPIAPEWESLVVDVELPDDVALAEETATDEKVVALGVVEGAAVEER